MASVANAVKSEGSKAYNALATVFDEQAEVLTVWRNVADAIGSPIEFDGDVIGGVEFEAKEAGSIEGNVPIVGFTSPKQTGHAWVKIQELTHSNQTARERQAQNRGRRAGALALLVVASEVAKTMSRARTRSKTGKKISSCCDCVLSKIFGQSKPQKAVETVARRRTPFGGPGRTE